MQMDASQGQQKRVAKVARLVEFFAPEDRREIYEWLDGDEKLDFQLMTNQEVEEYLKGKK